MNRTYECEEHIKMYKLYNMKKEKQAQKIIKVKWEFNFRN